MKTPAAFLNYNGIVFATRLLVLAGMTLNQAAPLGRCAVSSGLHIRQERSSSNHVLVSRPNDDDLLVSRLVVDNGIRTVEDYARWLQDNFRYQKAPAHDAWLSAKEILTQMSGDCDDFAVLSSTVIRVLGYQPRFFAFERSGRRAHAVCAFQDNGCFVWFDNARLMKTDARTFDEFKQHILTQYHYRRVLEYDLNNKTWSPV